MTNTICAFLVGVLVGAYANHLIQSDKYKHTEEQLTQLVRQEIQRYKEKENK
jgi:hypothetical protein